MLIAYLENQTLELEIKRSQDLTDEKQINQEPMFVMP